MNKKSHILECLYYQRKREQCELKVIDSRFTLSLKKATLSFAKNPVRLDVYHWEEREVIWVGLAMGPVIARYYGNLG